MNKEKTKIEQLEDILNSEEDTPIEILPNGEIVARDKIEGLDLSNKKPLTMRENLGGEY
jgi:hypothetical protein